MRALNSGSWLFCDFRIGWAAAGAGVCMIEMAVGWISDASMAGCLHFSGHIHPFHMLQTRISSLASDKEEENQHPPAVELDT